MHGTALALRAAPDASKHLRHAVLWLRSPGQGVAVIAVGRDDRIAFRDRADCPDRERLLPDVDVQEPADLLVLVGLHRPDLELANEQHVTKPLPECLRRKFRRQAHRFGGAVACHRGHRGDLGAGCGDSTILSAHRARGVRFVRRSVALNRPWRAACGRGWTRTPWLGGSGRRFPVAGPGPR